MRIHSSARSGSGATAIHSRAAQPVAGNVNGNRNAELLFKQLAGNKAECWQPDL
jgi:hypothetical protein